MVMPIGDVQRTRIVPFVNYLLIAANIAVFLLQQSRPDAFTVAYAATPFEITHGEDLDGLVVVRRAATELEPRGPDPIEAEETRIPQAPVPFPIWGTLLTSMFLHGGWLHLAGNMLYLWIFGDNVEEVLGHGRYLLTYLACGLAASLANILLAPNSVIPTLGASGAIAGVMGMYLVWFPTNQVRVLVIRFITLMPAVLVIGLWLLMQLFLGYQALGRMGETGGVAYAAHVGGAAAGIACALWCRERARAVAERPSDLGWASRRYRDRRDDWGY
jgi:membrane associated rhomboid family serine protease